MLIVSVHLKFLFLDTLLPALPSVTTTGFGTGSGVTIGIVLFAWSIGTLPPESMPPSITGSLIKS
jgi:hypothetical protein